MLRKKAVVFICAMFTLFAFAGCMKQSSSSPEKIDLEARYAEIVAAAERELVIMKEDYIEQIEQGIPFETDIEREKSEQIMAAERPCTPFHLYALDNYYAQYSYYVPFVDKDGVIQLIMSVVKQGDKMCVGAYTYMDDYIPALNEIQYQNTEVIVYRVDKVRYIESKDQVLPTASPWTLSFDEKKAIITESEMNLHPLPTPGGHSLDDKVG